MVSTETIAFVTVRYRGVAAFVPDLLEKKRCERRAVAVVPVFAAAVWVVSRSTGSAAFAGVLV